MKAKNFNLMRYDADEGMVFDWNPSRIIEISEGVTKEDHLYVKTLFIGSNDNILNYKEVPESEMITWNENKEKENSEA